MPPELWAALAIVLTAIITGAVTRTTSPPWRAYADKLDSKLAAMEARMADGEKMLSALRKELSRERTRFAAAIVYIHELRAWIEQHCHSDTAPPEVPPSLRDHL